MATDATGTTDAAEARSHDEALLSHIRTQEAELGFPHFTHDDAWQLGTALVELARSRNLPVALDVRRGAQQVFHAGLEGSTADNDDWIVRKNATVRRFEQSSLAVRLEFSVSGKDPRWLDPVVYAVAGGCVPVKVDGMLVGTASVSGLPDIEDHALVVEAMQTVLRRQ